MGKIVRSKYLKALSIYDWFHSTVVSSKVSSNSWEGLKTSFELIGKWLVWSVGNGHQVKLEMDPWMGVGSCCKLFVCWRNVLLEKGLLVLDDCYLVGGLSVGRKKCLSDEELDLSCDFELEWNYYVSNLRHCFISLTNNSDTLMWLWNRLLGIHLAKLVYESLFDGTTSANPSWLHRLI